MVIVWFIPETGSTHEVTNIAYDLGWIAEGNYRWRDIFSDNATGTNYCIFSDYYPGEHTSVSS